MTPEERARLQELRAQIRRCYGCGVACSLPDVPEECPICGARDMRAVPSPGDDREHMAVAEYHQMMRCWETMDEVRAQEGDSNGSAHRKAEDALRNRGNSRKRWR